jgi:hypothetical protein
MPPIRLTAAQWIETYRLGAAAIVEGRRHVVARQKVTWEPSFVEVEVADPDPRCALVDGRLDAQDLARVLTGFRGQPIAITPTMRYVRSSADGEASPYVFDEESGMVYILD